MNVGMIIGLALKASIMLTVFGFGLGGNTRRSFLPTAPAPAHQRASHHSLRCMTAQEVWAAPRT